MNCDNLNYTSVPSCKANEEFCKLFNAGNCTNTSYSFEDNWTTETVTTQVRFQAYFQFDHPNPGTICFENLFKFDLVCERESRRDNMQTGSLLGLMVGSFVFGNLAGSYSFLLYNYRQGDTENLNSHPIYRP